MQFPETTPADGWRDADALSPSLASRRWHSGLLVAAAATVMVSAGWQALDDPRPLDVQLGAAMQGASGTLRDWQGQLSRGLQVSLRAVADGRETAPVGAANMLVNVAPAGTELAIMAPPAVRAAAASEH